MDTSEWVANHTYFPKGTEISYSDDTYMDEDEDEKEIDYTFPDIQDITIDITCGSAYEGDTS